MSVTQQRKAPAPSGWLRAKRRSLLLGCALGSTLLVAAQSERAAAQAVNGTPATAAGIVAYDRSTPGVDTVTVSSNTAIVNWTPPTNLPPGPYVFLPQDNTLIFQNGLANPNFTVLNRILTTQPSRFDGTVISRLRDDANNSAPGGTVLFSSPGGIIVGATALFDVGNLVLTTLNVAEDGYGNFVAPGGGFVFQGGANAPNAGIVTEAGARILATGEASYVAFVAPVIDHGGSVRVNGSVAYIAGEEVSFSVADGLFDITVQAGSDNPIPIIHSGSTGGPASGGGSDGHGIYFAAVPKNQAITMLLSGSVGFDAASNVSVENGVIVLSAGHNVENGAIGTAVDSGFAADIRIDGGSFTSDVVGQATGSAVATAASGSPLAFDGSVELRAATRAALVAQAGASAAVGGDLTLIARDADGVGREASIEAGDGATIAIAGDATLDADSARPAFRNLAEDGTDLEGGQATVISRGGSITIGGALTATAFATGEDAINAAGAGIGGTVTVEADGGSIAITGDVYLDASGLGGRGGESDGLGRGGSAIVRAAGSGSVTVSGFTDIFASGYGGGACDCFPGPVGGDGRGGTAAIEIAGGSSMALGDVYVDAGGYGGSGDTAGIGRGGLASITGTGTLTADYVELEAGGYGGFGNGSRGGDGFGGETLVQAGVGGTFTFSEVLELHAQGNGGWGEGGGDGTGGTSTVASLGGTIDIDGDLIVDGSGFGGVDFGYGAFAPGRGTGGTASVQAIAVNGSGGSISVADDAWVLAHGGAGQIYSGGGNVICADCPPVLVVAPPSFIFFFPGGDGQGGTAEVIVRGADFSVADLAVSAIGVGGPGASAFDGAGTNGFDGTGGTATVELTDTTATIGTLYIDARGGGGAGGDGNAPGAGGNGTGGTASLLVQGSTPSLGDIQLEAGGYGGPGGRAESGYGDFDPITGGAGGTGRGGEAIVEVGAGGALTLDSYRFDATGQGGIGGFGSDGFDVAGEGGRGGDGYGGLVELRTTGGSVDVVNSDGLNLYANGIGGTGGRGGATTGDAGPGGPGGRGGDGYGGTASIDVAGGSVDAPVTLLDSRGFGGAGGQAGPNPFFNGPPGPNGSGTGGTSRIRISDGNLLPGSASLGVTTLTASGVGGGGTTTDEETAGQVVVEDLGTASGGLTMSQLAVASAGAASPDGPAFTFTSDSGPVQVSGSVDIQVQGDVAFTAEGSGGLLADGPVTIGSGGTISFDHDSRADGSATLSGESIDLAADVAIAGSADSLIAATGGDAVLAAPVIDIGLLTATGDIVADGGSVAAVSMLADGDVLLTSDGDMEVGFAQAGDDFIANAGGAFTGGTIIANVGSDIIITAADDLRLDNGEASGLIQLTSTGGDVLSDGLLDAGTNVAISAALAVDVNDITAGGSIDIAANGGALDAASLIAGADIDLFSDGDMTIVFARAGDDFDASALGDFTGGTVIATGLGSDDEAGYGALQGSNIRVFAGGDLRLDDGEAADAIRLTTFGGSVLGDGLLEAGSEVDIFAEGDVGVNGIVAGSFVDIFAGGDLETGDVVAGSSIFAEAGGAATLGALDAVSRIDILAGSIDLASATAGTDIALVSRSGDIRVGFAQAGDDFTADSAGGFAGDTVIATGEGADNESGYGSLDGSNIVVTSAGTLRLDDGDAADAIRLTSTDGAISSATALQSGGNIELDSAGDITVAFAAAGDDFLADAGGAFTGGTVTANVGSDIIVTSVGDLRLDDAEATGIIDLSSTAGSILSDGLLDAGTDLFADAGAAIALNEAVTGGAIFLDAGADLSAASLIAGTDIFAQAGGAMTLGEAVSGPDSSIFLDAGGSLSADTLVAGASLFADAGETLTVGSATATDSIFLGAGVFLDAASLFAGQSIFAQSDGGIRIGEAGAGASLFVSADGAADLGTLDAGGDVFVAAASILLASATAGGDIGLNSPGDISVAFAEAGDDFVASAGGSFTGGTVAATGEGADDESGYGSLEGSNIVVEATGTISLADGRAADGVRLTSFDAGVVSTDRLAAGTVLDIDAAGSIDLAVAEAGGNIELDAGGDITLVFAAAGDDFLANAGGAFTGGTVTANVGSDIIVTSVDDLRLDTGLASGTIQLTSTGGNVLSDDRLDAGSDVDISAAVGVDVNDIAAGRFIDISAQGGALDASSLTADGGITLSSAGDMTVLVAQAGELFDDLVGSINIVAGGAAELGTLVAGDSIFVDAGSIDLASATATIEIELVSTGDLRVSRAEAGETFLGVPNGRIRLTSTAGNVISDDLIFARSLLEITARNDVVLNQAETRTQLNIRAGFTGNGFDGGNLIANRLNGRLGVTTQAGADTVIGSASSDGSIDIDAGASISADRLRAQANIRLNAVGDLSVEMAEAGFGLVAEAGGAIDLVAAQAGGNIELDAGGDITVVFAAAGDDFLADAGGAFTGGTVTANVGSDIIVTSVDDLRLDTGIASGTIQLTSTGGSVLSDNLLDAGTDLEARAAIDIALTDAQAGGGILLEANRDLAARDLVAAGDITGSASGDLAVASAVSTQGGIEMFAAGTLSADLLRADQTVLARALGDVAVATGEAGVDLALVSFDGALDVGNGTAGRDIFLAGLVGVEADTLEAGRTLIVQTLVGDGDPSIARTVDIGTAVAGESLSIGTFGALTANSLRVFGSGTLSVASGTSIDVGEIFGGGNVELAVNPTSPSGFTLTDGRGGISVDTIFADGDIDAENQASGIVFGTADAQGSIRVRTFDADPAFAGFSASTLFAAGDIEIDANGAVSGGSFQAFGTLDIDAAAIVVASVDGRDINLASAGDTLLGGAVATDDFVATAGGAFAASLVQVGIGPDSEGGEGALAGGNLIVNSVGDLRLDEGRNETGPVSLVSSEGSVFSAASLVAGGTVTLNAGLDVAINDVDANALTIGAGRDVSASFLTANFDILVDAGRDISIGYAESFTGDIDLEAGRDIVVATAVAGDDFLAEAGGAFTGGTVTANVGSDIIVTSVDDLRLDTGIASGTIQLTSTGGSVLSDDLLDAGTTIALDAAAAIDVNDLVAGGSIFADAGGAATIASADSGGSIFVDAGAAADLGTLDAAGSIDVRASGIDLASATAGADIALSATVDIRVTFAQAGDDFTADAGGSFTGGTVIATGLGPDDEAGYGSLPGGDIIVDSNGDLRLDDGRAFGLIQLTSASGDVVSADGLSAGTDVRVSAGQAIDIAAADAGTDIRLSSGGATVAGTLFAGQDIDADAGGTIDIVLAEAGTDEIELFATGSITAGTLRAGSSISVESEQGDISVELVEATLLPVPAGEVEGFTAVAAAGDVRVGSASAANIGLAAAGDIEATSLTADDGIVLFAGGDTTLGDVTAGGLFYLGNPSTLAELGGFDNVDPDTIDSLPQQRSGGALTVTGTAQAGRMALSAGGPADLATLVADDFIRIDAAAIAIGSAAAGANIELDADGDISVVFAAAGDDFLANAGGAFTGGTVTANVGSDIIVTSVGDLSLDTGLASGLIRLTSTGGSVFSANLLDAGGDLEARAAVDIAINDAEAGGNILLDANRDLTARDLLAGGSIDLQTDGDIAVRTATAETGDISLFTDGDIAADGLSAGGSVRASSLIGDIGLAAVEAGIDLFATADSGAITIGSAEAGRDIGLLALVGITADTLEAGRNLDVQTLVGDGNPSTPRTVVLGSATAGANMFVGTFGALTADTLTVTGAGLLFAGSSTSIDIGTMTSGGDVQLFVAPTSPSGFTLAEGRGGIAVDSIEAAGNIDAFNASSGIAFGSASAGGFIFVTATDPDPAFAGFTASSLEAGIDVTIDASGLVQVAAIDAGRDIGIDAGAITLGEAIAGRDIELDSAGDLTLAFAQAGDDFTAFAGGAFAGDRVLSTGAGPDDESGYGGLPGGNIVVEANGAIRLDDGRAERGAIRLSSFGAAITSATSLVASAEVDARATGAVLVNAVQAGDYVFLAGGGNATATAILAGGDIEVDSGGAIDIGSAQSTLGEIELTAAGSIGAGTLRSGFNTIIESEGGDVIVDLVEANLAGVPSEGLAGFGAAAANGRIQVGSASAANIGLVAGGAIDAGSLAADDSVLLFAGGDVTLGTVNAGGLFYLGNPATLAVFDDFEDFDPVVFAGLPQQRSGGGLVITGPAEAGRISLAVGGDAQIASLASASDILLRAASLDLVTATAVRDITLAVDGAAAVDFARAGDDFRANVGSFAGGTILATGLGPDSEGDGANIVIAASGDLRLDNGQAATAIRLTSSAGSVLGTGALDAGGDVEVDSAFDILLTDISAGGSIDLDAGRDIGARDLEAEGTIRLAAVGDISFRDMITQTGDIVLRAGEDLTGTGRIATGGSLDIVMGGDIAFAQIDAARDILLTSNAGSIAIGDGTAGRDIVLRAQVAIEADTLRAGRNSNIRTLAGPISIGSLLSVNNIDIVSAGTLATGNIESLGGMVDLEAAGNMTLGNVRAAGSIFLTGGGLITALDLTAATGPLLGGGGGGGTGGTSGGIAPGFDAFFLPRNDDGATGAIALPFTVDFFGVQYGETFVSNNGYLTFNFGQGSFTPSGLGEDYSGQPIIAPFFADVDTRNPASAETAYGNGMFAGRQAFGATWDGVGYFPNQADKLNNFQVLLVDRSDTGAGNFDIYFNYARIAWETGSASGGTDGFGGVSAAVGYNAGTGNQPGTFFELPGSRVPGSFLDNGTMPLIFGTNNGVPGQLLFQVRGGEVTPGSGAVGNVNVTNLASGNTGNITLGNVSGVNVEVRSANDLTMASAAASTGEVDLFAVGTVRAGTLSSGMGTGIQAQTGDIIVDSIAAGGAVAATAGGGIAVRSADSGASITLAGVGDVRLDSGQAADVISLASSAASVLSANFLDGSEGSDVGGGRLSAGGDVIATAALDVSIVDAEAGGNILLEAGRDVGARNLTAAGSIDVQAFGTAAFAGAVLAPTIEVASRDIEIGSEGSLGGANTQLVALTVLGSAQTVLGGASQGPGYTLTDAEADRIRTATLRITVPTTGTDPGRSPDLLVRDLSLDSGRVGILSIATSGIAQVEGDLLLANAGTSNRIDLRADERLQIVTPAGSIRVRDAAGLPGGALNITSNNLWSATPTALGQLAANPNFEGRDALLRTNTGPEVPRGYIEAADVTLFVRDTLFVQNSGSTVDFAGITVVENTLRIVPTGTSPVQVFAFGRRINPDGSFVTNNAFFREVEFEQGYGAGYTDDSQFNLCVINTGVCRLPSPDQPLPGGPDFVEEPLESAVSPPTGFAELVDVSFTNDPLIEEPVTSGGDSILWDCDRDDDGDCDEDDRDG